MALKSGAVAILLGLVLATAATAGAPGPSYPCSKAQTDTEKAICGDPLLSALDLAVSRAYDALLAAKPGQASAIRTAQRDVVTKRDACDADVGCIESLLESRLSAMLAMTGTSGSLAKPGSYDAIPSDSHASLKLTWVDETTTTIDATVVNPDNQHLCNISGPVQGAQDMGGLIFIDKTGNALDGTPTITALDDLLVLLGGESYCGTAVAWPMIWYAGAD